MIIDAKQLSEEAINNLVDEYCLRDWGLNECDESLENRQQHVKKALAEGHLVIIYSQHLEMAQIIAATEATQTS
ncbi:MAG: hypothetical protein ACI9T9_000939 [Oleiphilaceae bacterium]|jgi:uncharacterized protein YheU (UPF0270 family)